MPKLAAKDRKKVDKAEATSGGFEPLEPGKYVGTLEAVESKVSGNGNHYWNCVFTDITDLDGNQHPGKQWYMVMLPIDKMPADYKPKSSKKSPEEAWATYQGLTAGRIKAFFEAFGYTTDSDTDEMVGDKAVLQIGVETIQPPSPKAGQATNRVNAIFSLDSAGLDDSFGGGDDDGDEF